MLGIKFKIPNHLTNSGHLFSKNIFLSLLMMKYFVYPQKRIPEDTEDESTDTKITNQFCQWCEKNLSNFLTVQFN
jgi:hypothetical protein